MPGRTSGGTIRNNTVNRCLHLALGIALGPMLKQRSITFFRSVSVGVHTCDGVGL